MLFTKEFYDAMEAFEKYASKNIRFGSVGLLREPKKNWHRQWYYSDGVANEAFKSFLVGYSFGKSFAENQRG